MYVGQTVWHVGKNVATKEVRVIWMSPRTVRDRIFHPEAPVLVERVDSVDWLKYALIPVRQLSETKPPIKCKANVLFHIQGSTLYCDRIEGHIDNPVPYEALHHARGLDKEIFWSNNPQYVGV